MKIKEGRLRVTENYKGYLYKDLLK